MLKNSWKKQIRITRKLMLPTTLSICSGAGWRSAQEALNWWREWQDAGAWKRACERSKIHLSRAAEDLITKYALYMLAPEFANVVVNVVLSNFKISERFDELGMVHACSMTMLFLPVADIRNYSKLRNIWLNCSLSRAWILPDNCHEDYLSWYGSFLSS